MISEYNTSLERHGLTYKVEELKQLNQALRDRDKMKDDAITLKCDNIVSVSLLVFDLSTLEVNLLIFLLIKWFSI